MWYLLFFLVSNLWAENLDNDRINIKYDVGNVKNIEEARIVWLDNFKKDYPDSKLSLTDLNDYVMENGPNGKSLSVACLEANLLPASPDLLACLWYAGCNQEDVDKLQNVANIKLYEWDYTVSSKYMEEICPSTQFYRLICHGENLSWFDKYDKEIITDWDINLWPYMITSLYDYIVEVNLLGQKAVDLLLILQNHPLVVSAEINDVKNGACLFVIKMSKGSVEDIGIWSEIEKIDEKNFIAIWEN